MKMSVSKMTDFNSVLQIGRALWPEKSQSDSNSYLNFLMSQIGVKVNLSLNILLALLSVMNGSTSSLSISTIST